MIRLVTAALVVFLVACGGGGGGGGGDSPPSASPELMALLPVQDVAAGTDYVYAITKTKTTGTDVVVRSFLRAFELDRVGAVNLVGLNREADMGASLLWTTRGLELSGFMQSTWWGIDGICVTLTSPGLLLTPGDFSRGDTHQCSGLGSFVESASVTWVGAEASPGHPDAERFDFQLGAPYTSTNPFHERSGATSYAATGTVYLAAGVGPVKGIITQQFLDGATVVQERRYEFILESTIPGP